MARKALPHLGPRTHCPRNEYCLQSRHLWGRGQTGVAKHPLKEGVYDSNLTSETKWSLPNLTAIYADLCWKSNNGHPKGSRKLVSLISTLPLFCFFVLNPSGFVCKQKINKKCCSIFLKSKFSNI